MKRALALLVLITLVNCKSENGGGNPNAQTINIADFLHGYSGDTAVVNHFIAFRSDANPQWITLVDNGHFIRYSLHTIHFPGAGDLSTIVSDNFNAPSMERATGMERSFYGKGWGRISPLLIFGPPPAEPGNVENCRDFGWNTPPTDTMVLLHCH